MFRTRKGSLRQSEQDCLAVSAGSEDDMGAKGTVVDAVLSCWQRRLRREVDMWGG